jgi:hypothetical protein
MVARATGRPTKEVILETTAWGGGGASDGGAAGAAGAGDARYTELLSGYACEAPPTLKTDKAKFHYIKVGGGAGVGWAGPAAAGWPGLTGTLVCAACQCLTPGASSRGGRRCRRGW